MNLDLHFLPAPTKLYPLIEDMAKAIPAHVAPCAAHDGTLLLGGSINDFGAHMEALGVAKVGRSDLMEGQFFRKGGYTFVLRTLFSGTYALMAYSWRHRVLTMADVGLEFSRHTPASKCSPTYWARCAPGLELQDLCINPCGLRTVDAGHYELELEGMHATLRRTFDLMGPKILVECHDAAPMFKTTEHFVCVDPETFGA